NKANGIARAKREIATRLTIGKAPAAGGRGGEASRSHLWSSGATRADRIALDFASFFPDTGTEGLGGPPGPSSRDILSAFLGLAACAGWQVAARAQTETAPRAALQPDDADTLISRALQLYSAGQYTSALRTGEQAAELLSPQGAASAPLATALMVQALCHKRLVHVAEA